MALGGQVDDHLHPLHRLRGDLWVGDIAVDERVPGVVRDVGHVGGVTRVRELVEVDHLVPLLHRNTHDL